MSDECIIVSDLRKSYGRTEAVAGVSFEVGYKSIFGFLGPNGAGKTTTIKVLTTLVPPTSGSVQIFGLDSVRHSKEIRRRIGAVLQEPSYEANLTVERALDLYGRLWKMPAERRKDRARELIERFDLSEIRGTKNDELSIGQRRRVQVAREFMHEMDLLFLDEPTVGLDPAARRTLLDYVKKRVAAGLTVFFTTHIMEEAEYICDEIAIINQGRIIATDTPAGLKQKYGGLNTIEIRIKEGYVERAPKVLDGILAGQKMEIDNNTIVIHSAGAQELLVRAIDVLSANSIPIESATVNPPSLEDVFIRIVQNK
ncbi:MAG: ABC transporter ATP-binding protein [Nitrososphaera sp.]